MSKDSHAHIDKSTWILTQTNKNTCVGGLTQTNTCMVSHTQTHPDVQARSTHVYKDTLRQILRLTNTHTDKKNVWMDSHTHTQV